MMPLAKNLGNEFSFHSQIQIVIILLNNNQSKQFVYYLYISNICADICPTAFKEKENGIVIIITICLYLQESVVQIAVTISLALVYIQPVVWRAKKFFLQLYYYYLLYYFTLIILKY